MTAPIPTESETLAMVAEATRVRLEQDRIATQARVKERHAAEWAGLSAVIEDARQSVAADDARRAPRLPADPYPSETRLGRRRAALRLAQELATYLRDPEADGAQGVALCEAVRAALTPCPP